MNQASEWLDDYEPDPHDRVYYRRARDGQLGWMIRRDGTDYIKLDRPTKETLEPFRSENWIEEQERRAMTKQQLAQVALEADIKFCRFVGLHKEAGREWIGMRDEDRREWIEDGPDHRGPYGKERLELWVAIMEAMSEHSR